MPGAPELLLILLVVVLLFGASRVPLIAENLAKGIKSFKTGLKDEPEESAKPAPTKAKSKK